MHSFYKVTVIPPPSPHILLYLIDLKLCIKTSNYKIAAGSSHWLFASIFDGEEAWQPGWHCPRPVCYVLLCGRIHNSTAGTHYSVWVQQCYQFSKSHYVSAVMPLHCIIEREYSRIANCTTLHQNVRPCSDVHCPNVQTPTSFDYLVVTDVHFVQAQIR
jgi:hypothetical protein